MIMNIELSDRIEVDGVLAGVAAEIFSTPDDVHRFGEVMGSLSPHIRETLMITGSTALEANILSKRGLARRRPLNDVDLVISSGPSAILPSITDEFLVHHFHPTREKGNVLMQLVEPTTKARVDVFSARATGLEDRAYRLRLGALGCRLISAEDLAARLLAIVVIVIDGKSVDPKYFDSLERLTEVIDHQLASRLWPEYRWGNNIYDFHDTLDRMKKAIAESGNLLKPTEYSQDTEAICSWCSGSNEFEIADPRKIHEILGYV